MVNQGPDLDKFVNLLKEVGGVKAIVLGGSRARGTHHPGSDYDLGLYYDAESPLDIQKLRLIAKSLDDRHQENLMTPLDEWGPWINGGGWLKVNSLSIDLLYRDLDKVKAVFQDCMNGQVSIAYQPGHPHGFVNSTYLAETALCQVLWESQGLISALKAKTSPYPSALKKGTIEKFMWEAEFSLMGARKGVPYQDLSYIAGCLYRTASCLTQVIYALNEKYWMNEKGAMRSASSLPICPAHFESNMNQAFSKLEPNQERLNAGIGTLSKLVEETTRLVRTLSE